MKRAAVCSLLSAAALLAPAAYADPPAPSPSPPASSSPAPPAAPPTAPSTAPSPAPTAPNPPPQQQSSTPAADRSAAAAAAETLFFTARGLMEAGRYGEAASKLEESYRLDPAAGTLLNLAVCHQKIGKIASAWGDYKTALADARRLGRPDREELALAGIAAVEPDLPFLTIQVPPSALVPGLEVVRNDVALNRGAWATELPVDPGTVVIVERAPGYLPKTKTLTIALRQHLSVSVEPLLPAPIVTTPATGWTPRRSAGAALFVAGVLGAGAGGVFGGLALNKKSQSDANCPIMDGDRRCTTTGASDMTTANTFAWVSDIAIGVGAASILAGIYLFVTGARHDEDAAPPSAGVRVSAGAGQAWLTGSF